MLARFSNMVAYELREEFSCGHGLKSTNKGVEGRGGEREGMFADVGINGDGNQVIFAPLVAMA